MSQFDRDSDSAKRLSTHSENQLKESIAPARTEWVSAFNTSLLTTRANQMKDRSAELAELVQSPEFDSLLLASQHLASSLGISKEDATERLIDTFRKIDSAWKKLVMQRGLQSLIE